MDDLVEFAEVAGRGAEWLLVDDPGPAGQPVLPQRLGQLAEGDRRDGQVMDQLRTIAERGAGLAEHLRQAAGAAGAEPAAGEENARREGVPVLALGRGAELGERIMDMGAEIFVRDVAATVTHQQPPRGQEPRTPAGRSRQHHALGQVTGRPEENEIAGRAP